MVHNVSVEAKLQEGIKFLVNNFSLKKEINSFSSYDQNFFGLLPERHTTFYTACSILALQNFLILPELAVFKKTATAFLLEQKSDNWSFNYWKRGSLESRNEPYPDDLDDTALALSALYILDKSFFTGDMLAQMIMLLTSAESQEGGPYFTWINPPTDAAVWKDIDNVVNANIAYLLSLQKVHLPKLNIFLKQVVQEGDFFSPYYVDGYPLVYFISRIDIPENEVFLKEFIISRQNNQGNWGTPFTTALMVSALLRLGYVGETLNKGVEYLCAQSLDDIYKPDPVVVERVHSKGRLFSGSPFFSLSVFLEALQAYHARLGNSLLPATHHQPSVGQEENIYQVILQNVTHRFSHLAKELQPRALEMLGHIVAHDQSRQIGLLPWYTWKNFKNKSSFISNDIFVQLGLTNVYGWIAYTIYDDFLDAEGDPALLSVANVCLRSLTTIYEHLLINQVPAQRMFHRIMDVLEGANCWEVVHCRAAVEGENIIFKQLPDYKDLSILAKRSLGHALTPLMIFSFQGLGVNSFYAQQLLLFFENYFVARQLNDDLHDWQDDLRKGHITSTVAILLQQWRKTTHSRSVYLPQHMAELQKIFWYQSVNLGVENIFNFCTKAERALKNISVVISTEYFLKLLNPLKYSAHIVLNEQKKVRSFLGSYH